MRVSAAIKVFCQGVENNWLHNSSLGRCRDRHACCALSQGTRLRCCAVAAGLLGSQGQELNRVQAGHIRLSVQEAHGQGCGIRVPRQQRRHCLSSRVNA